MNIITEKFCEIPKLEEGQEFIFDFESVDAYTPWNTQIANMRIGCARNKPTLPARYFFIYDDNFFNNILEIVKTGISARTAETYFRKITGWYIAVYNSNYMNYAHLFNELREKKLEELSADASYLTDYDITDKTKEEIAYARAKGQARIAVLSKLKKEWKDTPQELNISGNLATIILPKKEEE